jgi:murein DD-endopeptidase MepM/ murein hydrolase activator NlpD
MKYVALAVAILAGVMLFFWGSSGPAVSLTPDSGPIGGGRELTVKLEGPRGVKKLTIAGLQGERKVEVLVKEYPPGVKSTRESFTLAQAGLKDGPLTLRVVATGYSLFHIGGRTVDSTHAFTYDATPPTVAVLSTAHNIIRGGAGLVVYTVSKEVEKTGVVAADRFYPGYRQKGNFYACLFPFPFDMEPVRFVPRVIAVDRAGNERLAGINYHLLVKPFSNDTIDLSDSLLEKIAAEFKNRFPQAKSPLEIFLKANGELREQNRKALVEFGRQTSPVPLWQGDFQRMPNSAPLGGFAQSRTYLFHGQKVDQQTHLGFDLASVAHAPVPAANQGKVVFAGDLGIYGQCVVIDHGLGLQTLYGHLSRIGVKGGESVAKGQVIGNSGSTGMAAGDHLHFGVLVSGQEVNPVEWWDRSWIRNNVTGKLELGGR